MRKGAGISAASGGNTEMVVELRAGPITAAQLGVPVGTVVAARHVVSAPQGFFRRFLHRFRSSIVSPDQAVAIRKRIAGEQL